MVQSIISPFIDTLNNRVESLFKTSENGQKAIGYFCHYTPIELIHACGFMPVRISGGPGEIEKAYGLAPDFICPFMKRSLEKALAGEYRFLSGLIQGYTCDIACGMTNIWADNIAGDVFHILPLPYKDSQESRQYLENEHYSLINKLTGAGGSYSESSLKQSLELYGSIRALMQELYNLKVEKRLPLTASELWHVIHTGFICPPEDYLAMLLELKENIGKPEMTGRQGIPVLVSGSLIESPEILDLIESRGGYIVADDLCSGQRAIVSRGNNKSNPLQQLADNHFNRVPCPSRSRAEDRFPLIKQLVDQSGARGVIFMLQKFCTPHLCDHPFLSKQLQESGIPSVMIELDETRQTDAQVATRLEGLFEILGD